MLFRSSKVFSFTPDYEYYVNADEVIKGGSGYCIELKDGREVYNAEKDGHSLERVGRSILGSSPT